MLDLIIRGGTVYDGTGKPGIRADVGIEGGRIIAIGNISDEAAETIDATGLVVAPGFIDVHTHYDAQVFWDPDVTPSSEHGVTTILGGNCGFSIAPLNEEAGPYLMRMLARVEGIPLASLEEGVPWNWESFGEYLGELEGKLAINAGFLAGHSAIRRVVMGERSLTDEASAEDLEAMKSLLRESIEAGALGFSTTRSATHADAEGLPVPSRHAARSEVVELARVCGEYEGTCLECIPSAALFGEEEKSLMTDMSVAAGRPLNWNLLPVADDNAEFVAAQLSASDHAAERGGKVVALSPPQDITVRINLAAGFLFDALGGWAPIFRMPIAQRIEHLKDPEVREELDRRGNSEESGMLQPLANWEMLQVVETFSEQNKPYEGMRVGEIAQKLGKMPFDTMIDLAINDDLNTSFMPYAVGGGAESWSARGRAWLDPRVVVGASDAGAHLDMIDTFAYSSKLLQYGVREFGVITLEEAVRQLTDVPARLVGLVGRGRIEVGYHADFAIFDADEVGAGPIHSRFDLPAGALRLYCEAQGVRHVIVSGTPIIKDGERTGYRTGNILRSGIDTETPSLELTA